MHIARIPILRDYLPTMTNLTLVLASLLWTASVIAAWSHDGHVHESCPGKCPPGWTFWGEHCYRYFGYNMPWREAETYCNQFGVVHDCADDPLAHLVSIHSEAENTFARALWESQRPVTSARQYCWIGLNDLAEEGTWVWTDGSVNDFLKWGNGQPNSDGSTGDQDCASLDTDGTGPYYGGWDDSTCSDGDIPFLCKMLPYSACGSHNE